MRSLLALLLASGAVLTPVQASAQSTDISAVQEQLAAMQAEIARLTAEVGELKAREEARETAPAPAPAPTPASTTAIAWKGAPEITGEGGWSFKPRGRLQIDSAVVDGPSAIAGNSLGVGTEFRRAYIGFEGSLPATWAIAWKLTWRTPRSS
jgi:phosphate-selective porin OprO and OprP